MAQNLTQLEQDWLAAESMADRLKDEARRIDAELEQRAGHDVQASKDNVEITVLLTKVEDLHAKHEQADRAASEAFDRFWMARDGG